MDEDLELYVGSRYSIVTMIFFIPYVSQLPTSKKWQMVVDIGVNRLSSSSPPTSSYASSVQPSGCPHWSSAGAASLSAWVSRPTGPNCWAAESSWACSRLGTIPAVSSCYHAGMSDLGLQNTVIHCSPRYIRYEVQKRFSAFYLLALLASGFSNILAYGLSEMAGIGGLNGWQWIFAIEGAITVVLGVVGFIFIVDFPDKATRPHPLTKRSFLSEREASVVISRIQCDRGDAVVDDLTWQTIMHHLRDWKIWEFAWLYFLVSSSRLTCLSSWRLTIAEQCGILQLRILPAHHFTTGYGLQRRNVANSLVSTLRRRNDLDVRNSVGR